MGGNWRLRLVSWRPPQALFLPGLQVPVLRTMKGTEFVAIPRCAKNKREAGYVAAELRSEVTQGQGQYQEAPPPYKAVSFPKIFAQNYYPMLQVRKLSHKAIRQLRSVEISEHYPNENQQGSLFRVGSSKGGSCYHLLLVGSAVAGKGRTLCALIGGCWQGEPGGKLTNEHSM